MAGSSDKGVEGGAALGSVRSCRTAGTLLLNPLSDHLLRLWPNATTSPQPFDQLAISRQKESDTMLGKSCLSQKRLNFFNDRLCHVARSTRYSV